VVYDDISSYERESVISRIWVQLEDAISEVVDNITLKDIVEWQAEQVGQYCI
jgi:DNA-binding IscR family transcriptional regulator